MLATSYQFENYNYVTATFYGRPVNKQPATNWYSAKNGNKIPSYWIYNETSDIYLLELPL